MTAPAATHAAPKRIQRSRAKGWRMPANVVYVGRPSRWGNPWAVGLRVCACRAVGECTHNLFRCATPKDAAEAYRHWIAAWSDRSRARLADLRGKDLACWCPLVDKDGKLVPCHADVLIEAANA